MDHLFLISQPAGWSKKPTNDYTNQCCSQLTVALIEWQCWKNLVQTIDFSWIGAGIEESKFCRSLLNRMKFNPSMTSFILQSLGQAGDTVSLGCMMMLPLEVYHWQPGLTGCRLKDTSSHSIQKRTRGQMLRWEQRASVTELSRKFLDFVFLFFTGRGSIKKN